MKNLNDIMELFKSHGVVYVDFRVVAAFISEKNCWGYQASIAWKDGYIITQSYDGQVDFDGIYDAVLMQILQPSKNLNTSDFVVKNDR